MTKASDNAFPSLLITEGTEPSAPAAGKQRMYIDSTTHVLMLTNSSGTETAVGSGAGNYTGVPWSSGTSMPGGPATNQRITRTDLGLDFFYDGTRWLTTTLFHEPFGTGNENTPLVANGTPGRMAMWHTTYDLWLVTLYSSTYVLTTNDGTKYWNVAFQRATSDDTRTDIATFTTAADAASTWITRATSIGSSIAPATYKSMSIKADKTSTPGNLYYSFRVTYRLIGT